MPPPGFMLPDGDFNPESFSRTYLNKPVDSIDLKCEDYETFVTATLDLIHIFNLPTCFASYINNQKEENKDLSNYWMGITFLCQKQIPQQIQQLYKYISIINLLDGFDNIKDYLRRALIKNEYLWDEFLMSMDCTAKELSGVEGNSISELVIIRKFNPSQEEIRHSLKYIKEVTNNLEKENWLQQLQHYTKTNIQLLYVMTMLLQSIGLIDREESNR